MASIIICHRHYLLNSSIDMAWMWISGTVVLVSTLHRREGIAQQQDSSCFASGFCTRHDGQTIGQLTGEFVDGQTIGQLTGEFVDGQTIGQLTGEFVNGQTIIGQLTGEFVDGQTIGQLTGDRQTIGHLTGEFVPSNPNSTMECRITSS
jgi:hypothetical protein